MKHESAYAVFIPDGRIYFASIRQTEDDAIKAWCEPHHWSYYQDKEYTVRPVTVTETEMTND